MTATSEFKVPVNIVIEKYDHPQRYDDGAVENYRVHGEDAWTGYGFEHYHTALKYALAVLDGMRLAGKRDANLVDKVNPDGG